MRPGRRLRSLAGRVCSRSTMDRLIDPLIADMQCEDEQANRRGQRWSRVWTLVEGYVAFWTVLLLHVPVISTRRVLLEWTASDHRAIGRALGSAALTMIILTAVFIAPPLRGIIRNEGQIPWLLVLLLPQSLPLSLPPSVFVGVLYGLRNRAVTFSVRRAILVIGLVGSLVSFGTIKWLMPAANQAFRVTIARQHLVRGLNEMSFASLREQALAKKHDGRLDQAGTLFFSYHARWALIGAALVFALFGLGVTALRAGRAATAGIGMIGCVVYVTYFFEMSYTPASVFSDEPVALALAWLPNILLILASAALLSAAHEPRLPDQASGK
jgi:hypothetical protein